MRNSLFSEPPLSALINGYDAWAPSYDRDVFALGYCSPDQVAEAVCRELENPGAALLDVGAGTGLLGATLCRRGYRNLHGMDASHGMLVQAARKGVYRSLCRMVLGRPLGYADRAFDGLMAAGVFSSGHVPAESLAELGRLLRPGGRLFFSLKWDDTSENRFLPQLNDTLRSGCWRRRAASDLYAAWPGADATVRARVLVYQML